MVKDKFSNIIKVKPVKRISNSIRKVELSKPHRTKFSLPNIRDAMDLEFMLPDNVTLNEKANEIKNKVFPLNCFRNNFEREKIALHHHSIYDAKSINKLCYLLAKDWYMFNYCSLCHSESDLIIDHKQVHGEAGVYRGVLCKRCKILETYIKDVSFVEKVEFLYQKLKTHEEFKFGREYLKEWVMSMY